MKQSKPYPKPTTKMVIDQTLRGKYAMNCPYVPEWYIDKLTVENSLTGQSDEEIYFQWRWYYADRMIETEFKK